VTINVAFFGYYFPFLNAGTSRLDDFAKLFQRKGVKVAILTPTTIRKRAKWVEIHEGTYVLRFLAISSRKIPIIGTLFSIISSFIGCLMLNLLRKVDVIIFSIPPGETALGAIMVCKLIKKPFVLDVRDEWENFRISTEKGLIKLWYLTAKKLYNKIYNNALFCIAINKTIKTDLLKRGIKKVYLLPHGIDTSMFAPRNKVKTRLKLGLNPKDFIVIFAGVFQGYYRIDIVIKAIHKLISEKSIKNIRLLIVGWGPKVDEYIKLVKALKLSKNVYFVGPKPRQEIPEYLICSDVGLIPRDNNPSLSYAIPLKFTEYCSCALPIVASSAKQSALAYYIEKWRVGLTVQPLNVEKMARAIEFLYYHNEIRNKMGKNARLSILKYRDREKIASKLLMLLSEHLKKA